MTTPPRPLDPASVPVLTDALDIPDLGEDVPDPLSAAQGLAPAAALPAGSGGVAPHAADRASTAALQGVADALSQRVTAELMRRLPALIHQVVHDAVRAESAAPSGRLQAESAPPERPA